MKVRLAFSSWMVSIPLLIPSLLTLMLGGTRLPAAGAADSTLIIPGKAVGVIHLGMSVREVTATLGAAPPGEGSQLQFPRLGITVSFTKGIASQIWTTNRLFRTKFGAGVGISPHDATRLVGEENSVRHSSGDSLTLVYPFQGIGFVFRAGHAVAVFVKPPLTLGPANILGPSNGTIPPVRWKVSGVVKPQAPSAGPLETGSPAVISSGTLGVASGAASADSGPVPLDAPAPLPPVSSVSVDSNGNLTVNGRPFLLIQATNMDYVSWLQAGYTEVQADAKMSQLRSWGFNTLFGNWGDFGPGYQDVVAWKRHGLYWHGSATLSEFGDGNIENYGLLNNPAIVDIITRFKARPNLLLWWICDEYDEGIYAPTGQPLGVAVATGRKTIANTDPTRAVGETIVIPVNAWVNDPQALLPSFQVPLGEEVIAGFMTSEAFLHAYDYLNSMQPYLGSQNGAPNFALGFSTTPVPELDNGNINNVRVVSKDEIHRYFMLQVAMNVRAFDVLWGPNQRDPQDNTGDAALSQNTLNAWQWTGQEIARIKSLESVILAPGLWKPLTTTPAFEAYAASDTNNDFKGVYAAKKTVAGVTYVIAINADFHEDAFDARKWTENPLPGATIDLGFAIKSATRLFETGAVSFSGRAITDSFVPMGVHVYAVR